MVLKLTNKGVLLLKLSYAFDAVIIVSILIPSRSPVMFSLKITMYSLPLVGVRSEIILSISSF